jgi:beta-N-acetylhexosaminidase
MSRTERGWGEIFVMGYQGLSPSPDFIELMKSHQIGGIIFFERNIETPGQLRTQIEEFQKKIGRFLFFMVDQEGGRINRVKRDFPLFPSNKVFGDRKDYAGVRDAYRTTAVELRKLGINVNLAPVADLIRAASDYMSERSFGSDPEITAGFVRLAIEQIHSAGIFACAKHFPGIGGLKQDPHQVLPESNQTDEEFRLTDFIPFQAAVSSQVEMVMTTHVRCPALDEKEPATFSYRMVHEILQGQLGFQGLVVTDDMEMGGVVNYYDIEESCFKAFLAGHDLILLCHSLERQKKVLKYFEERIAAGEISQERIEQSLSKIGRYKQGLLQNVSA